MPTASFVDELPKVSRGRVHVPGPEDEGVAALVKRGGGAVKVPAPDDTAQTLRGRWQAAARRAGVAIKTVVSDGHLYVALK